MKLRIALFFALSMMLAPLPATSSTAAAVQTCHGEEATIVGTLDADVLVGTPGDDVIVGLAGNDTIFGRGGDDVLCGNKGWDRIFPGPGVDYAHGGRGARDWVFYSSASRGVVVSLTQGVGAGQGRDTLVSIENIFGSPFDDKLIGNTFTNRIVAGDGDDQVWGKDGDDFLWGSAGDDLLRGQAGFDKLNGDSGFDVCFGEQEFNCEEAGSGGLLKLRQWQAPASLNPYRSTGTRDLLAASLVLEPLAEFTPDGEVVPVLATTLPTVANGGVAADFTSITWTLIDTVWSDGTPLTASDVVFTYEYCSDPLTGCSAFSFEDVASVEALNAGTVKVTFDAPNPYPYEAFVGFVAPIIQEAQFENCVGEAAAGCIAENSAPIGTGPFLVTELRANDRAFYAYNPNYRDIALGKPFFGTVRIVGGGSALAAARAVLEHGIADYAWNLQVAPAELVALEANGIGTVSTGFATNVEHINLNQTDPEGVPPSDYNGGTNPNPFFFENEVLHDALSMAIDRTEIVEAGYGPGYFGKPTCNIWTVGAQASTNNDSCLTQDIPGANALLDASGYLDTDEDGVRETPEGEPLEFEFVTSTNAVRQGTQALIKGYWDQIGVQTIMRNEDAGVFFNPQSDFGIWKFFTDMQMFTNGWAIPDPSGYLGGWTIAEIPESTNSWVGANIVRLASPAFEALHAQLAMTPVGDPARDALVIQLNDIIVDYSTIPLLNRGSPSAFSNEITGHGELNGWDSEYWNIQDWRRHG